MNTFIGLLLSAGQGDGTLPLPLGHAPREGILCHLGEVVSVNTPEAAALLAQNVAGYILWNPAVIVMVAPQELRHAPAYRHAHHDGVATSAAFEAALHCLRIPGHLNPR
ncbi:hypothetical protein [Georgenia muralis]